MISFVIAVAVLSQVVCTSDRKGSGLTYGALLVILFRLHNRELVYLLSRRTCRGWSLNI